MTSALWSKICVYAALQLCIVGTFYVYIMFMPYVRAHSEAQPRFFDISIRSIKIRFNECYIPLLSTVVEAKSASSCLSSAVLGLRCKKRMMDGEAAAGVAR